MTPHHLILIRHTEAASQIPGGNDHARVLTPEGEQDARNIAAKIAHLDIDLAHVHLWHSTAVRTTMTANAIAQALPASRVVMGVETLYDLNRDDIIEMIRETPQTVKTLIVIGHNPSIAEICHELTSNAIDGLAVRELMRGYEPGTATVFSVISDWAGLSPCTASLDAVLRP